jgi:hypothetical protein
MFDTISMTLNDIKLAVQDVFEDYFEYVIFWTIAFIMFFVSAACILAPIFMIIWELVVSNYVLLSYLVTVPINIII